MNTFIEDAVKALIIASGDYYDRPGLRETPRRFREAWMFHMSGYDMDPANVLKTFEDGADNYDEMIIVKNIPFYSTCEHHLAPFFGTVSIAYIPKGKIVGLSKLPRLVEIFAHRLQVQERLTTQIAEAIDKHLQPLGVAVTMTARHLCMESRGIQRQGHETITSAMHGAFRTNQSARNEFLQLIK